VAELGSRRPARPPIALGCAVALTVLIGAIALAAFSVTYLESGAETRTIALAPGASYAFGSVTSVAEERLYVVRLGEGTFLALADLNDASRAAGRQECRVAPIAREDPRLAGLLARHDARISPAAKGLRFLFTGCDGALYDVTGIRIDGDGANLDRYATSSDDEGRLTVDLQDRTCSERLGEQPFREVACGA